MLRTLPESSLTSYSRTYAQMNYWKVLEKWILVTDDALPHLIKLKGLSNDGNVSLQLFS